MVVFVHNLFWFREKPTARATASISQQVNGKKAYLRDLSIDRCDRPMVKLNNAASVSKS